MNVYPRSELIADSNTQIIRIPLAKYTDALLVNENSRVENLHKEFDLWENLP